MGLIDRLFGRGEQKSTSANPEPWFVDWVGGGSTLSGERVSPERSMRLAAVWACVRVRSEDVGKLPCFLYRRTKDGGKERASDHPVYKLIHNQPNPRMTAMEFRQMMQAQLDLRGNAYALKEFDTRGRLIALWPIDPTRVVVLISDDGKDLFYRITTRPGQVGVPVMDETVPAEAILHLRGQTLDGVIGLSPIAYHKETIGLAIAAEKYGAAFFGNSAQPRGGIKTPTKLDATAAQLLRDSYESKHRGVENAHKIAIFDGGMEYVQIGMDNTDAQYIETRGMQNREIWRIYRVPPHKVGDLDKATFSNIEQQALEYVTDCLMPELVRWEQTLARDLLTEAEQGEYFFEFLVDSLLRGDLLSRYQAYAIGRNWGWLSVNDICDRENMNRVPNGDIRLQPLNMIEAGTPPRPAPPPSEQMSPATAKALLGLAAIAIARSEQIEAQGNADANG